MDAISGSGLSPSVFPSGSVTNSKALERSADLMRLADGAGMKAASSNGVVEVPTDPKLVPEAIAHALSRLRYAGVDDPYSVVLSADLYTDVSIQRHILSPGQGLLLIGPHVGHEKRQSIVDARS